LYICAVLTNKGIKKNMTKKKYKYFYPVNKALGDQLPGMSGFLSRHMLKGKFSQSYIRMVMNGERTNKEIIAAMKYLVETSNAQNY